MFRGSVFYEMWMACETAEERAELWQAIMEYWMFGKEPPQKFKRDFVNVRFILDKSKSLKQKRSDAWKQHTWNQYTQWDSKRKSNQQAQKTSVEQMEQVGTNGTNKNKNKNIKENIKRKYLENVLLSDEEYEKLVEKYGKWTIERKIEDLNNYIGSKWKKYKSHYFTILERLRREWAKPLEKKQEKTENNDLDIDTRASWLREAFPLNK